MTLNQKDREQLNKLMPPLRGRDLYIILVLAKGNLKGTPLLEAMGVVPEHWAESISETVEHYMAAYAGIDNWINDIRNFEVETYRRHFGKIIELNPRWTEEHNITPAEKFESHFHVSCCPRCDAPAWGQPCIFCDFYPRGDKDWIMSAEEKAHYHISFETFLIRFGYTNFAGFYFESHKRSVAYNKTYAYKQYVHDLIIESRDMDGPTPEGIWAATKFFRSVP